jgi:cell wall-associated NlpC family hydrolase
MKAHFDDESHVTALLTEAASWRHTPFRFGSRAKGRTGGTDCVGLCEALLLAAGAVDSFNFPRHPADMSRHVHNDRILNYLRGRDDDPQSATLASVFQELNVEPFKILNSPSSLPFAPREKRGLAKTRAEARAVEDAALIDPSIEKLEISDFLPGDLLLLRTGKGLWHMPVMLSPTAFMQCAFPDGVTEGDITAPNYNEHLVAAFRARAK